MNLKVIATLVGIAAGVMGGVVGYFSATMQADAKVETKVNDVVDRAMAPVNRQLDQITGDVRQSRDLLSQILLSRHGGL